jgi:fumarylacetoacetase
VTRLNETHDAAAESWVESAHAPGTDFPIQNLPFGVFRRRGDDGPARVGVAIGAEVLDVAACLMAGLLPDEATEAAAACANPSLNALMALGREAASGLRRGLFAVLKRGSAAEGRTDLLVPMEQAELLLPADVGDYTDFYASVHHATNVGSMFRPDNPLLPNYKWVPIGYHGRASSLVPSGTPVRRPRGQLKGPSDEVPAFGASRSLDYECEVGMFVGPGNALGTSISLDRAEEHLWGFCLVNDWSARDVQSWEYQPLGPFLAKNFGTTLSPWVVTADALEPYRVPRFERPEGDPQPLPHLDTPADRERGGVAITVEVWLRTARMREAGQEPARISRGSFADMYWTAGQMLAHHASNGCNLRPGDLLASGTISGPTEESRGCMLERTWRGANPLALPNGEERKFVDDGDEVILRGFCEREGFARIGFGEAAGVVLPAEG